MPAPTGREILKNNPRRLLALLCWGFSPMLHAADEQNASSVAQPSEWVARGFVAPGGEPTCLTDAPPALNRETLEHLCEDAKKGAPKAQHNLGQLFFLTKGAGERDYDNAYKWFNLAAKQGLPAAQYGMGLLHTFSLGIVGNRDEAMKWLSQAANSGHANAQYALGLYYAATIRASEDNALESVRWLRRSAEQGNPLATEVLSNTTKRRASGSRSKPESVPESDGEYDFSISLAACTEGYDLNHQKSASQKAWESARIGASKNNTGSFRYFTPSDLLRAINVSPERYMGMMGTCFDGSASRLGPGFSQ